MRLSTGLAGVQLTSFAGRSAAGWTLDGEQLFRIEFLRHAGNDHAPEVALTLFTIEQTGVIR
jgi:hypothetical protein